MRRASAPTRAKIKVNSLLPQASEPLFQMRLQITSPAQHRHNADRQDVRLINDEE